jgi:hypothetical protein
MELALPPASACIEIIYPKFIHGAIGQNIGIELDHP